MISNWQEILPLKEGTRFKVDAKDLYNALQIEKPYGKWLWPAMRNQNTFEGVDFVVVNSEGGQRIYMTTNLAKNIASDSRTDIGFEIRNYLEDR